MTKYKKTPRAFFRLFTTGDKQNIDTAGLDDLEESERRKEKEKLQA